ncbi:protein rolling stone-like [Diadema antillarum]|uniref:protein rolling stone-like n=1 Tax=Diadema antillarum TaxID=105358 RepID=UPI003A8895D0
MASEGSPVLQRSPTTVQTTINSEDESRKWYSVQWADLKLCSRRLRDVSTPHPRLPICLYVLYRFIVAAYFLFVLIIYYGLLGMFVGPKFLIYFDIWTFLTATCYVCFAFLNAAFDFPKSRRNATLEDKFRYQIQWFLFYVTAVDCIIVFIFDWWYWFHTGMEEYDGVINLFSVSSIALPVGVCLIEIFLTLIVVRFVHVVYPLSYLFVYLLYTVIYLAAGDTDIFGNHFSFFFLDFKNHPGIAAATTVGATFAAVLAQAILKGLYALRVRCMDSE